MSCRPARPAILAAVVAAAMLPAGALRADGELPAAVDVAADRDGDARLIATTFGLLVAMDDGSYRWICEDALGHRGSRPRDLTVDDAGTLYVATHRGLRRSGGSACRWQEPELAGLPGPVWVEDLAVAGDGAVWLTTATTARDNDVLVDRRDGRGFRSAGLRTATGWWKSVVPAPGDPHRLYLSGYQVAPDVELLLRRSDDGGESWFALPTADLRIAAEAQVFIEAVSPVDPDRVYARVSIGDGDRELLVHSADGGHSWQPLLDGVGSIHGVAVRRDGSAVVATERGVYRAPAGGGAPLPVAGSPNLRCLVQSPDGELYGCAPGRGPGPAVLRSADGQAWNEHLRFEQVEGSLPCLADGEGEGCGEAGWARTCRQLGACRAAEPRPRGTVSERALWIASGVAVAVALALALWLSRRAGRD